MFNFLKRSDEQAIHKGHEAGEVIAAGGETIDTVNWKMVHRIATENGLHEQEFAFGVLSALEGWSFCFTCRCSQPAEHECID